MRNLLEECIKMPLEQHAISGEALSDRVERLILFGVYLAEYREIGPEGDPIVTIFHDGREYHGYVKKSVATADVTRLRNSNLIRDLLLERKEYSGKVRVKVIGVPRENSGTRSFYLVLGTLDDLVHFEDTP